MAATTTEKPSTAASEAAPAAPAASFVRRPWLWLLLIVAVAVAYRAWYLNLPLQLDEFSALHAVAGREYAEGSLPTTDSPLWPAASWHDVVERSVLPYGIPNPVPLYHYLLYGVVQTLPIAEWSLRLPSLVAGVACVVVVFLLCWRVFGAEVGVVAALVAALDPIQVATSALAEPYALANLACVLSFAALLAVLRARRLGIAIAAAMGYAVATALTGYFNPVLLAVVVAQLGVVIYQFFGRSDADGSPQPVPVVAGRAALWLAGCGLALLLMWPEMKYWAELRDFSLANEDVLGKMNQAHLLEFLSKHNSALFVALLVVVIVGYVSQRVPTDFGSATTEEEGEAGAEKESAAAAPAAAETAPAEPAAPEAPPTPAIRPMDPAILWLGGLWVFVPQIVMLWLAYRGDLSVLFSRYLTYTTLGGAIFLAYWVGRYYTREGRLSTTLFLAGTLLVFGLFVQLSKGYGLFTLDTAKGITEKMDEFEARKRWLPGDVAVHESAYAEAYLLPDRIPAERQSQVRAALLAPFTTLYVPSTPKKIVLVELGLFRNDRLRERTGSFYQPETEPREKELAEQLRGYQRFWVHSPSGGSPEFMHRFLPWLADAVQKDLVVARNPQRYAGEQRYFVVPAGISPQPYINNEALVRGLSNARPGDFGSLVAVRQMSRQGWGLPYYKIEPPSTEQGQVAIHVMPREPLTVGSLLGAAPTGYGAFAIPASLSMQYQSLYVAPKPEEEGR